MILQINRDFPFQVALSFDEAAMDVLDWLEGQSLPEQVEAHLAQLVGWRFELFTLDHDRPILQQRVVRFTPYRVD